MARDQRYDILFEPVKIGPVTAPNRFYQTPHAIGLGWQRPKAGAALRGIKAEGGWGVVCTEYCSIHPTSDDSPYGFLTLWDEDDVAALAQTADAMARAYHGVVIVHGTDRLAVTGEQTYAHQPAPAVPIVFTGAMRPYELRSTDALQNLTEALLAVQILPPGVYVSMHNQVLAFPGVVKDRERGTFVKLAPTA